MRKISTTAFLLAIIMIFAGCNLIELNDERDMLRAVIKVDGQEILKQEYVDTYYSLLQQGVYYQGYSVEQLTTGDYAEDFLESVKNTLINQKILEIKAKEYGCYDFTQDELDDIQSQYDELIDSYRQSAKSTIAADEKNADLTQDELDVLIENSLNSTLSELGFDEEAYMNYIKDQTAIDKLKKIITETEDPTESEIQAAYVTKVSDQQSAFEDPSQYESALSSGSTIYYNLPDVRNARHILIALPDESQTQISELRSAGDDDAADALLKDELAKIKDEADMVYGLATEDGDFDELIAEYGQDPGMGEDNYYTVINPSTSYVEEFASGLFSLKSIGDFTQPISSDFGYHIILYAGDVPEGAVALEDVKDGIVDELLAVEKNELYATQMEAWNEEMKVKIYNQEYKT